MSYGFLEKFHIHMWNVTVKRKNIVKDLENWKFIFTFAAIK